MSEIVNVVFDFGNVLVRYDPRLLYDRFFADPAARDRFLREVVDDDWNREIDRGRPFAEAIAERIALHPEFEREIRAWDERWHEMVPGPIEGTVELLARLRAAGVPLYAITNFSREKYAEAIVRFPFLTGFRDVVVSGHERLVKPDPAIFRVLVERNRLDPATCLFIDDVAENVATARNIGMAAVRFISPEQLAEDLAAHGIPAGSLGRRG